jgi:Tat protein secretion system quality control protein TatD with DNase activity
MLIILFSVDAYVFLILGGMRFVLIDTHLHLHKPYMQENRLDKVIANINENKILTWAQSCDLKTHEIILEICNKSKYLFPSFGVLPCYAHEVKDKKSNI